MDKYKLNGIAKYYGKSNLEASLTGEICVKQNYFEGIMNDSDSIGGYQKIKGIFVPNNLMKLTFFKIQKHHELISLGFDLVNSKGDFIEGEYQGSFLRLPYRIEEIKNEQMVQINYPDESLSHEINQLSIFEYVKNNIKPYNNINLTISKK